MPASSTSPAASRMAAAGGADVVLRAWRCGECRRTSYPSRRRCPFCWSESGNEVRLPHEGEVHSFTTVHVAPPGVDVPYTVAYVDVGDVRLFARVEGEPSVGARGRIHAVPRPDDPPESTSIVIDLSDERVRDG